MKKITTRIKYGVTTYANPVATEGIFIRCEVDANGHVRTVMQQSKLWTLTFRIGNPQTSDIRICGIDILYILKDIITEIDYSVSQNGEYDN
jgi:hypothetical protein